MNLSVISAQIRQYLLGVGVGLDLRHDLLDHALLVDDEGCTHHAHADLAVALLLLPHAVGFDCLTGASGRIVSRVEVKHDLFPKKVAEADVAAILIRQRKLRRFCSDFQRAVFLLKR